MLIKIYKNGVFVCLSAIGRCTGSPNLERKQNTKDIYPLNTLNVLFDFKYYTQFYQRIFIHLALTIMDNLLRSWPLCTQKNLRAGIYNILYLLKKNKKNKSSLYDTETFGDQSITIKLCWSHFWIGILKRQWI